ncbi:MAG: hypothetical protein IJ037_13880 [Clostridia bacterium]|nr:hypothetical protein [Clostridia bacterium]
MKKSGITTFYRLTEEEKNALIEQCRRRMEEEQIQDEETIRRILEELLDSRYTPDVPKPMEKEKPQPFLWEFLKELAWSATVMFFGMVIAVIFTHPTNHGTYETKPSWITGEAGVLRCGYNYEGFDVGNGYVTSGEEFELSYFRLFGRIFPWVTCYFPGGNSYYGFWDIESYAPKGFGLCSYAERKGNFQLREFDAYEIGFWDFAEDMEYTAEDGTVYLYTGMMLSGEEHGYGILEDADGVRRYAGEFRDGQPGYGGVWFTDEETQENSAGADINN